MRLPRVRFTLSLRAFMILVLVAGGLFGWMTRRALIQRRAVAEIRRVGGRVAYDYQLGPDLQLQIGPGGFILNPHPWAPTWLRKALGEEYFQDVAMVVLPSAFSSPRHPPPSKETFAAIASLDRVGVLALSDPTINDSLLSRLAGMPRLKQVVLTTDAITDSGLAVLRTMPALEDLRLHRGRLRRATVDQIMRLRGLKRLSLNLRTLDDPRDLSRLADATWLEWIDINSSTKDPSLLFHLRRLARLRNLRLGDIVPNDSDLANLAGLKALEFVDLDFSRITDAGLAHLSGLTRLRLLLLHEAKLTDDGMRHLAAMVELRTLLLNKARLTDKGVAHLQRLTRLEILDLGSSRLTDAGLAHLAGMSSLTNLSLGTACPLTDRGLAAIAGMNRLAWLRIAGPGLTDDGLAQLKKLDQLFSLDLPGSSVSGPGLLHLAGLGHLSSLDLSESKIDDAGLAFLTKVTSPHFISVRGTSVTAKAAEEFRTARPDVKLDDGPVQEDGATP